MPQLSRSNPPPSLDAVRAMLGPRRHHAVRRPRRRRHDRRRVDARRVPDPDRASGRGSRTSSSTRPATARASAAAHSTPCSTEPASSAARPSTSRAARAARPPTTSTARPASTTRDERLPPRALTGSAPCGDAASSRPRGVRDHRGRHAGSTVARGGPCGPATPCSNPSLRRGRGGVDARRSSTLPVVLDGVRIASPISADQGGWVHDGWVASRFVPALRPAAPDWATVVDAGLRFGDACEAVRRGGEDVLDRRHHRWAVADRVAWGTEGIALSSPAAEVRCEEIAARLLTTADPNGASCMATSVATSSFDPQRRPPGRSGREPLRPRRWAEAIVVTDAVLWEGADAGAGSVLRQHRGQPRPPRPRPHLSARRRAGRGRSTSARPPPALPGAPRRLD